MELLKVYEVTVSVRACPELVFRSVDPAGKKRGTIRVPTRQNYTNIYEIADRALPTGGGGRKS